jgi:preprotein translocase subunit YajC
MFISNAYAQAAATATEGGSMFQLLPIVLMFVILYFLMIRPQQKRAKEQRSMLEALQKGDEVVTVGGILGKIVKVSDAGYLTLEVGQQGDKPVEMLAQKSAVQMLLPKGTIKSL